MTETVAIKKNEETKRAKIWLCDDFLWSCMNVMDFCTDVVYNNQEISMKKNKTNRMIKLEYTFKMGQREMWKKNVTLHMIAK